MAEASNRFETNGFYRLSSGEKLARAHQSSCAGRGAQSGGSRLEFARGSRRAWTRLGFNFGFDGRSGRFEVGRAFNGSDSRIGARGE